jgi:hypothetical protein
LTKETRTKRGDPAVPAVACNLTETYVLNLPEQISQNNLLTFSILRTKYLALEHAQFQPEFIRRFKRLVKGNSPFISKPLNYLCNLHDKNRIGMFPRSCTNRRKLTL